MNVLNTIEQKLVKIARYLKRSFGNQNAFDKALREAVNITDKNNNITVDQLKGFVLETCKDQIIHRNISKKDVEAFLSAFIYNSYGSTNVDSIAKMIFTEENYVAKKLSRKVRANPPPDEVNDEVQRMDAMIDQDFYSTAPSEAASQRRRDNEEGGDRTSQYKTTSSFSKPVD